MRRPVAGAARKAVALGAALILLLLASPSSASAHTLQFIANATTSTCVDAGQTKNVHLYDHAGPGDKTWVVNVGADVQYGTGVYDAYFRFWMMDNANSTEIARFEGAAHEWIQIGTKDYRSTFYAHAGGTFDLWFSVVNAGSINQCFGVLAYAAYK